MKKIFSILVILLVLCGCQKDNTGGVMDGRWESPTGVNILIKAPKVTTPKYKGTISLEDDGTYKIVLDIEGGFTSTYTIKKRGNDYVLYKGGQTSAEVIIEKTSD